MGNQSQLLLQPTEVELGLQDGVEFDNIILLISIFLLTPSLYYFISLKLNINPSLHFMFSPNMTNNLPNMLVYINNNNNNTKPQTITPPDWVPDQSLLTLTRRGSQNP